MHKQSRPGLSERNHIHLIVRPPEWLTIDLDATLIGAHSEKEGATGNYKGGFGFHPLLAYLDETSETATAMLRSGNAGADQIRVAEAALEQIPPERVGRAKVLLRIDSAGASHNLLDWARDGSASRWLRDSRGLARRSSPLPERA